jgi:uncharacterized protein with PIN domain
MRFIADGMLGKLTRWLRLMGHDVEYLNDSADEQLIERARAEERILLTGDVELYRRSRLIGISAYLVKGKDQAEQLAILAKRLNLKLEINPQNSRCPICNSEIKSATKDMVKDAVPTNTFKNQDEFWICTNCSQIFWKGSHWIGISKTLMRAKELYATL